MKRKMHIAVLLCLFVMITPNLFAQYIVTGSVRDDTGQVLPGVNVVVKGTTNGTLTDINGKFSISVPNNATLVFSFVGMSPKEVIVGNELKLDSSLTASIIGMNEVMVTALGISREKKSLAYSVSEVKGNELTKSAGSNLLPVKNEKLIG